MMELLLKPLTIIIFLFCLTTFSSTTHGEEEDEKFRECNRPYECGDIRNLFYPFWAKGLPSYCGHPGFEVSCRENQSFIMKNEIEYRILSLTHSEDSINTLRVARVDLLKGPCSPQVRHANTSLNYHFGFPISFPPTVKNLTLFYCNDTDFEKIKPVPNHFSCHHDHHGKPVKVFYEDESSLGHKEQRLHLWPGLCKVFRVPIVWNDDLDDEFMNHGDSSMEKVVGKALNEGFEVNFPDFTVCQVCKKSGGICGYTNTSIQFFRCFCDRGVEHPSCPHAHEKINFRVKSIIAAVAAVAGIILMGLVFFLYQHRNKKRNAPSYFLSRSISSNISSVKDIEKGSTYFGVHVFTYEELVEATNNFDSSKELGDGGFGTVYFGKLHDGREVAVKRLYESNCRRVEQFMNEVNILASLRHPNLVSLFGCTSRHSHGLLLVYEYIPNGTVADHLHGQRAKPGAVPWPIRLKIAIETACALTYLHASDIVHRDVKTTNILLDSSFSVKVADFGLSRLFPTHVTHVSTAPQGTPGYVDPEYHQCYQLTSKSDVYSFGVVLMELVSSMPAVDIARHRHDINLSTMAINRIQNHTLHEIVDPCLKFDTDSRVKQTIIAVAELAFQCLQNEKDMRPSMADVLEELKAIQSRAYDTKNAKNDSTEDDAVLLNCGPLSLSPDTVTISWSSRNTTPSASG
ncbi:LEAF RUST 10 DISEASE-RESISTANCE LOCUS RECEPTOR-LIKE PROTEIN KINASE-like 1.2 isoform X3 [Humulus lupulus]|uniref:LEAF RUST 10 DISEASE-RESISTANCE LOCUS RECEPTOR-LIKE PROTEIN KINASE-like 1.2 isoform X3 n=1 Tax=Humulus lupulus TaxID=3486 RepID=UPI002B4067CE|nr:LEAF RUST 10 DISEASE-RESISTANCE LOCUS RECEPTOR-LIKE PROTEIN KINASE-like 1.2 isoform X3 [Humulus lupulus]